VLKDPKEVLATEPVPVDFDQLFVLPELARPSYEMLVLAGLLDSQYQF
jgi:hypothetical protein